MEKRLTNKWRIFAMTFTLLLCWGGVLAGLVSCSSDDDDKSIEYKYGSKYTVDEFKKCYSDDRTNKTITFLLDCELWEITEEPSKPYVRGSFNSWKDDANFKLTKDESEKFYSVTVPYSSLIALGNSGHPEYKFNTDGTDNGYLNAYDKDFIPEPYCFHISDNNLIIIYEGEDIADIKECSKVAGTWKALSDWNLTDEKEVELFANFRKVPGTTNVYRSWHPYKVKTHKADAFKTTDNSKGTFVRATEPTREEKIIGLYEKYGIKTDICLSEDETNNLLEYALGTDSIDNPQPDGTYQEAIPTYYQKLLAANNVLHMTFTNEKGEEEVMAYKYIYQSSYNEKYLNDALQCIIDFVKEDHPAPYDIHCRLGNDRTGYYCAVISGLCGASWKEIAEDYQLSNKTYLGEYRDQRLLKQVFEKQFKIADITNYTGTQLKEAMYTYYTTNDQLKVSKEDLDALVAKFTATE